jgi:hypothetical protein
MGEMADKEERRTFSIQTLLHNKQKQKKKQHSTQYFTKQPASCWFVGL